MEKIRYRLVFNRKNELNKNGMALVQVEASLNKRKVYMTTNIYLKPEWWDKEHKEVVNHPQAEGLNLMLWQFILDLQNVEIELWKRGTTPTLAMIKSCGKEVPDVTFKAFAQKMIDESDRSVKTKENLKSTVRAVCRFRQGLDFKDITYGFLKAFEQHLRDTGKSTNTVGKHMRQLRTIVNEAINHGLVKADDYPFRKYKIRSEKGHFEWLTPQELKRLENLKPAGKGQRHVLDAFLFCCYTGLRYSDFVRMKPDWMERINGQPWLHFFTKKTHTEVRLPLHLLFRQVRRRGQVGAHLRQPRHECRLVPHHGCGEDRQARHVPRRTPHLRNAVGVSGRADNERAEDTRAHIAEDYSDILGDNAPYGGERPEIGAEEAQGGISRVNVR